MQSVSAGSLPRDAAKWCNATRGNREPVSTILIIDDHDIVRYGTQMLFDGETDLRVVATAASLAEGLDLIGRLTPGVVVTDMGMADSQGLETVRKVVAAQSPRPVIVVSMQDEMLYGERVLAMGALGYIMKETAHAQLIPAVRSALAGQPWVSAKLSANLIRKSMRSAQPAQGSPEPLTGRELEILELLKSGRTTKEIAAKLNLSVRTVDIHRSNLKRKLHLRTGAELISYASRL